MSCTLTLCILTDYPRLVRNILADKPRVTKFPVEFDPPPADMVPLAGVTGEVAEEDAGIDVYQNGAHTCWIT